MIEIDGKTHFCLRCELDDGWMEDSEVGVCRGLEVVFNTARTYFIVYIVFLM